MLKICLPYTVSQFSYCFSHSRSILEALSFQCQTVTINPSLLSLVMHTGCEKEAGSSMWIYVLLGNLLRGIGETPIQPLGIAYIDDYAVEENAALYIGKINIISFS